mgnify:CR=1 FL=1
MMFRALTPQDWGLVDEHIGVKQTADTRGIVAVREDKIVAICVFNYWSYSSVQAHFWIGDKFVIRHGFLHEVANYVFNTCGKELMVGVVPADNDKALKMDKHIGFRETHRIKNGYKIGVDFVLLEATREDLSRWLEEVPHGYQKCA